MGGVEIDGTGPRSITAGAGGVVAAHLVQETQADARALPLREDDHPAGAHAVDFQLRRDGEVAHGLVLDKANEVFRGDHAREFQIVMLLKGGPPGTVRLVNLEVEGGTPSKAPPGKLPAGRVEDPARFQPVEDIVMAGEQYAAPGGAAPRFGKGQRAEARNLAVNNGGELIDDNFVRGVADEAGEAGAEFFAIGQDGERAEPRGHVAKAYSGEGGGDFVEVAGGCDGVDDGTVGGPAMVEVMETGGVSEDAVAEGGLAGAGGTDDDAKFPVEAFDRKVGVEVEVAA